MAAPTDVSGLVQRWRADSIAQANGTAVSSWPALVGGVALTQPTTANQPTYQTSGIGGKPAVKFATASSQYLLTASAITQAQPATIFVVHQLTRADSTIQELLDANGIQMLTLSTGYDCWATGTDMTGGTMTLRGSVLTYVANGASSAAIQDGTTFSTANGGTSGTSGAWNVGRQSGAIRYLDGSIAEILVYNRALSSSELATVHSYIQDTYGITVAGYVSSGSTLPASSAGAVSLSASVTTGTRLSSTGTINLGGASTPAPYGTAPYGTAPYGGGVAPTAQALASAGGAVTLGGSASAKVPGSSYANGTIGLTGSGAAVAEASIGSAGTTTAPLGTASFGTAPFGGTGSGTQTQITLSGSVTGPSPHFFGYSTITGDGTSLAALIAATGFSTLTATGAFATLTPALAYATLQTDN